MCIHGLQPAVNAGRDGFGYGRRRHLRFVPRPAFVRNFTAAAAGEKAGITRRADGLFPRLLFFAVLAGDGGELAFFAVVAFGADGRRALCKNDAGGTQRGCKKRCGETVGEGEEEDEKGGKMKTKTVVKHGLVCC